MKRRTWKRTLLTLSLFILAGAIINVAVAWGCRHWSQSEIELGEQDTGFGFTVDYEVNAMWGDVITGYSLIDIRIGWPMRSIRVHPLCSFDKWICGQCNNSPRTILVLGFAINTIFYAVILWVLFTAPSFVRRRIRINRGLCPACAYPVGSSDVCTECGAPLPV